MPVLPETDSAVAYLAIPRHDGTFSLALSVDDGSDVPRDITYHGTPTDDAEAVTNSLRASVREGYMIPADVAYAIRATLQTRYGLRMVGNLGDVPTRLLCTIAGWLDAAPFLIVRDVYASDDPTYNATRIDAMFGWINGRVA